VKLGLTKASASKLSHTGREHLTRRCSRQSRLHFCPLRLESSARATMQVRAGKRARG
jgi:hypothetical protein